MNRKNDGRASIERAADVNVPAHQFHESPAERQAQARAFLRLPPAFGLHERLKEQRQFFLRNAAPGIFDFERKDMRLRVARQTPHAHGNAARVREFDRVIQQIDQHLPQFYRVRAEILRHVVGAMDGQGKRFAFDFEGEKAFDLGEQPKQVAIAQIQRQAANVIFGQIEDLIDEREQMLAAAVNDRNAFLRFRKEEFRVVLEELSKTDNRVQRRAEFVAHVRQKYAFGAVGVFSLFCRLSEFLGPLLDHFFQMVAVVAQFMFDAGALFDFPV